jgi:hypothetical protein
MRFERPECHLWVSSDEDGTLVSAAAAFRDFDGETVRYSSYL